MSAANLQSKRAVIPEPENAPPEKASPISDSKNVEHALTEVGSERQDKLASPPKDEAVAKPEVEGSVSDFQASPSEETKKRSINDVSNCENNEESKPDSSAKPRPNDFNDSSEKQDTAEPDMTA